MLIGLCTTVPLSRLVLLSLSNFTITQKVYHMARHNERPSG